ncbi:thioesterase II family protein [Paenibacillus oenotherae]|nr:thioesterase domain-containing protein [Paenibacillus oenotherae]
MQLFCLPYAGGSAAVYKKWSDCLESWIELVPIELSGRGNRFNLPFYSTIKEAVDDVQQQIVSCLKPNTPYAIWGHSMGALLSYEAAHSLSQSGVRQPDHLFVSGSSAPNHRKKEKNLHNLDDEEFMRELKELQGTPADFFENKELVELFLPIIRNDFKISEQYIYEAPSAKLRTNISVLYGNEEKFINKIHAWSEHTEKECRYHEFQGGHFFIFDHIPKVTDLINGSLSQYKFIGIR